MQQLKLTFLLPAIVKAVQFTIGEKNTLKRIPFCDAELVDITDLSRNKIFEQELSKLINTSKDKEFGRAKNAFFSNASNKYK